ncbi:hypothetical protein [Haloprofundus salilacus]|uniref:hypothetical protein n=1 Tax=Haloprofundus salilacus TaxID=2876190 RepID=UPI001CCF274A|nr:hypothetical protein [Haloprofundus salilacus]
MARNTEAETDGGSENTTTEMDNSDYQGEIPENISYRPRGRSINIVESDSTALDASRDLIDNVVDAVKRRAHEGRDLPDKVQAIFEYDSARDRIIIKDNAYGGVHPKNLGDIPAMGASSDEDDLIGHFGVGGLRPAVLGSTIKYASSKPGYPASEITVDVKELRADEEGDEDVFVSPRRDVELEEGWTRIIIEDLRDGITSLLRSALNEIGKKTDKNRKDDGTSKATGEDLLTKYGLHPVSEAFGQTYTRLLRNGIKTVEGTVDFDLKLLHDDSEISVEPADFPELVPLAPDGLWSREYRNVPFSVDNGDNPEPDVTADVRVGVKVEADEQTAGLYVSIQDRMVLYSDLESRLFESQYLGTLRDSAGHFRLVIHVDLKEIDKPNHDRTYLPINSGKNGFDYNSSITPRLLSFISNAAGPYKKQGYDSVPQALLNAYSQRKNSANFDVDLLRDLIENVDSNQLVCVFDKKGSKTNAARVRPKPGEWQNRGRQFPERDALLKIAYIHAYLRIRVSNPVQYLMEQMDSVSMGKAKALAIGYNYILSESEESRSYHDMISIEAVKYAPSAPVEVEDGPHLDLDSINSPRSLCDTHQSLSSRSPPNLLVKLKELAEKHVNEGVRADKSGQLSAWQKPRYLEYLTDLTNGDLSNLELFDGDLEFETGSRDESIDSETEYTTEKENPETEDNSQTKKGNSRRDETDEKRDDGPNNQETAEVEKSTSVSDEMETARPQRSGSESGVPNEDVEEFGNEESQVATFSESTDVDTAADKGAKDTRDSIRKNLPEKGIIIVNDGEQTVIEEEQFEKLVRKIGDVEIGEDFVERIIEQLERKEKLEQAVEVFKNV